MRLSSKQTSMYSWDSAILAHLYRKLCHMSLDKAIEIVEPITLLHVQLFI